VICHGRPHETIKQYNRDYFCIIVSAKKIERVSSLRLSSIALIDASNRFTIDFGCRVSHSRSEENATLKFTWPQFRSSRVRRICATVERKGDGCYRGRLRD